MRSALVVLILGGCFRTPTFHGSDRDGSVADDADVEIDARPVDAPPGACAALYANDLVAYYAFDEVTGGKVSDGVGANLDGTVTSAIPTSGRVGNALLFDSNERKVVVAPATEINQMPEITTCAWIKLDHALGTLAGIVVDKSDDGGSPGWNMYINQKSGATSSAFLGFYSSWDWYRFGVTELPLVTWTHVCTSWTAQDGASGIKLYVDGLPEGVQVEARLHAPDPPYTARADDSAYPLVFGHSSTGTPYPFPGSIDEVVIYDRVLAPSEILAIKNCAP